MALLPPLTILKETQGFGPSDLSVEPSMYGNPEVATFGWESGLSHYQDFHPALDYSAPLGTPILASEAGRVIFAGTAPSPGPEAGGGLIVDIQIAGGMHYVNCHCSLLLVKTGSAVKRGQLIAKVGKTGFATGYHDHFQLYDYQLGQITYHNPKLFLPGGRLQNDKRIQPPVAVLRVCLSGPGVNVRTAPKMPTYYVYRTSTSKPATNWPSGYLLCWSGFKGFTFGGWVIGDGYVVGGVKNNVWGKIWLNSGWRYVAKPLLRFV